VTEDEPLCFGPIDAELMLGNIQTAVEIRTRPAFFSWVQGKFQSMLAHEVLVCGLADHSARGLKFEWVGSFPISEERFAQLCRADGGLLYSLVTMWQQGDQATLLLGSEPGRGSAPETQRVLSEIREFGLGNSLADGFVGLDGRPFCFFAFFKMPAPPCLRTARVLRIWLPYLYAAWLRVASGEATRAEPHAGRIRGVLTAREVEILNWVGKGKTNGHIARILGIGETTVATHLERIFRKLGVRSRAQAVARGMTLNLEQGSGPGWRYYS
jgi:transcriptional regulator EpsA